jgi:hypothetical protein
MRVLVRSTMRGVGMQPIVLFIRHAEQLPATQTGAAVPHR